MDRELRTQARLSRRTLTTQADIGNTVYGTEVHSVNGKAGHVVLNAEDVGALPSDTPIPSLDGYTTEEWVQEQGYATEKDIPTNVSAFNNDAGYLTEHQDISGKADKATTLAGYGIENAYTKEEVDALVDGQTSGVKSVNGKTGTVTITAQELGALTSHQDISGKADKSEIPTKTSDLTNDSGFLTSHQDISGKADKSEIPTKVSDLTNDAGYLTQHQSLSGYATEAWVRQQGYLTQHQSLANYALKSEIPTVTNDFTDAYKGKVDSLWEDYQDAITALG
jgi:hypothetical protein